jgi:hypothetical protein
VAENENEIVESNLERDYEGVYDDGGYGDSADMQEAIDKELLPESEDVLIPIFMRKGADHEQLGDGIYDPKTQSLVVKFNTPAGDTIAEVINSGMLAGISFGGMMSRKKLTNN